MTDEPEKRKHGVGYWCCWAVLALVVGYPLSFGPACWVACRMNCLCAPVSYIYRPLAKAILALPEDAKYPIADTFCAWGSLADVTYRPGFLGGGIAVEVFEDANPYICSQGYRSPERPFWEGN